MMNVLQAVGYQPSAIRAGFALGKPKPTCCEGRGCPDRTAPVFVVGALLLCAACRDYRNDRIWFALRSLALGSVGREGCR